MNTTKERNAIKLQHRQRHIEELQKLGYIYDKMNAIKRVENRMNWLATEHCNGTIEDKDLQTETKKVIETVTRLFGGELPDNFFINLDARGYALKIDQSSKREALSYTDWGGYGILAPEEY